MHKFTLMVLFLLSLFAVFPLVRQGYFPMHDDTQVARVITMGKTLREGQFPVRWVKELGYGYGYPIFNFYGPLPYYFGGFFYMVGFSGLAATKIMFFVGALLPAVLLYLVLVNYLGVLGSLVAAVFYEYAPYHAVQIYVRGAVGEYWILIFWPLILHGVLKTYEKEGNKEWLVGVVGLTGAIISHTLMGYVTALFFGAFVILGWLHNTINNVRFRAPMRMQTIILILGMGVSAFFWFPALIEMGQVQVAGQIGETAYFGDHFVCIGQFWNSLWGFGGSTSGCIDGMSFRLGKIHILTSVLTILFIRFCHKKYRRLLWTGLWLTLVSLFFMLPLSSTLWGVIPRFPYLQYPWRFLSVASFGMALMAGVSVSSFPRKQWTWLYVVCVILGVIYLENKWFRPQYSYDKDPQEFETYNAIAFDASKISDEYLPLDFERPYSKADVPTSLIESSSVITLKNIRTSAVDSSVEISASTPTIVRVNTVYFPGWHYYLNDKEVIPTIIKAIPYIEVPLGTSIVKIKFISTFPRMLGNIVSLVSICVVFYYANKQRSSIT